MSEPVTFVLEKDTASALYGYLSGENSMSADQLEDAKNSIAQGLAVPFPSTRDKV